MSMLAEMARATHAPLRSQVVHQLFFQYATRLNEQAAVNGFVRHAHALVVGMPILQPPGICSGDQSKSSLLATMSRNLRFMASRPLLGRKADCQACASASWAR